jgi:hypothetical protein
MQPARSPEFADDQTPGACPLRVLLVVGDPDRHALMQRCARSHLPCCHIDVVGSCLDALDRATRMEAHLLVLDLSLDSVLVPAFKRFLARAAPQSMVHVFDDSVEGSPDAEADGDRPAVVQLKKAFAALSDRNP